MIKKLKLLLRLPLELWSMIIIYMPGTLGYVLRYRYWKVRLRGLGPGSQIGIGVSFQNPSQISIGARSNVDHHVILLAGKPASSGRRIIRKHTENSSEGTLEIGDYVHIAPFSVLSGMGGLVVGNHCKIGSHASIFSFSQVTTNILYLTSMQIGDRVVIGTNSSIICVPNLPAGTVIRPNTFVSETLIAKERP